MMYVPIFSGGSPPCQWSKSEVELLNPTKQAISVFDTYGLVQDCNNSNDNALELLQSCTKPSIY